MSVIRDLSPEIIGERRHLDSCVHIRCGFLRTPEEVVAIARKGKDFIDPLQDQTMQTNIHYRIGLRAKCEGAMHATEPTIDKVSDV